MSADEPCPELRVVYPKNEAVSCWWLAANAALFHKRRPELDAYFAAAKATRPASMTQAAQTVEGAKLRGDEAKYAFDDTLKDIFQRIYNHYTGGTPIPADELTNLRIEPVMRLLNTPEQFDVTSNDMQDVSEYLGKLLDYMSLSFIMPEHMEQTLQGKLFDLFCNQKMTGYKHTVIEDVQTAEGKQAIETKRNINPQPISFDQQTLIFFIKRISNKPGSKYEPVKFDCIPFETVNVPVTGVDGTLQKGTFELDAMIAAKFAHYEAYMKCSKTEGWLYYQAMSSQPTKYDSFEALLKEHDHLVKEITYLFYTKVDVKASTQALGSAQAASASAQAASGSESTTIIEKSGPDPGNSSASPAPQVAVGASTCPTDPTKPGNPTPQTMAAIGKVIQDSDLQTKLAEIPKTETPKNRKDETIRLTHIFKRFQQLAIFLETCPDGIVRIAGFKNKQGFKHYLGTGYGYRTMPSPVPGEDPIPTPEWTRMNTFITQLCGQLQKKYGNRVEFDTIGRVGSHKLPGGRMVHVKAGEGPTRSRWHVWGANMNNWFLKNGEFITGGGQVTSLPQQMTDGVFGINTMDKTNESLLNVTLSKPYNK